MGRWSLLRGIRNKESIEGKISGKSGVCVCVCESECVESVDHNIQPFILNYIFWLI